MTNNKELSLPCEFGTEEEFISLLDKMTLSQVQRVIKIIMDQGIFKPASS